MTYTTGQVSFGRHSDFSYSSLSRPLKGLFDTVVLLVFLCSHFLAIVLATRNKKLLGAKGIATNGARTLLVVIVLVSRPDDLENVNRLVHALAINWWTCHEELADQEAQGSPEFELTYLFLLVKSATLLVTGALLVVTRSYFLFLILI